MRERIHCCRSWLSKTWPRLRTPGVTVVVSKTSHDSRLQSISLRKALLKKTKLSGSCLLTSTWCFKAMVPLSTFTMKNIGWARSLFISSREAQLWVRLRTKQLRLACGTCVTISPTRPRLKRSCTSRTQTGSSARKKSRSTLDSCAPKTASLSTSQNFTKMRQTCSTNLTLRRISKKRKSLKNCCKTGQERCPNQKRHFAIQTTTSSRRGAYQRLAASTPPQTVTLPNLSRSKEMATIRVMCGSSKIISLINPT